MEPCTSNHEQIMQKLAKIEERQEEQDKRMDKDMVKIDASYNDLVGRAYTAAIIKFIGFSGITWLIVHFSK